MEQTLIFKDGQYTPDPDEPSLEHGRSTAGGMGGLQFGDAFAGGAAALVIDGLVSGLVPTIGGGQMGTAVSKLLSAWALNAWGPKVISHDAARFGATLLVWDAVQDVVPIKDWVSKLVGGLKQGQLMPTPMQIGQPTDLVVRDSDMETFLRGFERGAYA